MGKKIWTREEYDTQHLRVPPKKNLILNHYMISAWWLNMMDGTEHYVIHPGAIENLLTMANNLITFGYT